VTNGTNSSYTFRGKQSYYIARSCNNNCFLIAEKSLIGRITDAKKYKKSQVAYVYSAALLRASQLMPLHPMRVILKPTNFAVL
jgi:exopolyphosphatase/pppGpp-phosphohydrolase